MTLANSVFTKATVAFVALATAFVLAAPAANAQMTETEMESEIDRLTALIEQLTGELGGEVPGGSMTSSVCPYNWSRNLNMGATGMDVMKLQQFLNSDPETRVAATGVGSAGQETQYYGGLTGAAVAKFQSKYRSEILQPLNLVNATTFFGPSTRAQANDLCTVAPPPTPTPGDGDGEGDGESEGEGDGENEGESPLSGEASLDSFEIDDPSDTDVEEGAEDAEIAEFTIEFDDGDAEIDRIEMSILAEGETDTSTIEPWDVFETISFWVDGDKIAEEDADDEDDWLDEDNGTFRISDLQLIGREGEEVVITVGATIQNGLETSPMEIGNWELRAEEMRFFDADGVSDDDNSTGDLSGNDAIGTGPSSDFEIQEEGDEDELRVRSDSNDPDATTIELEDDETSDFVTIFSFDLDTEDSPNDIQVEQVQVDVDATEDGTTATSTSFLIDDAQLVVDGEVYDDVSISHGTPGTFTFDVDDEDWFIDAGDRVTVEFQVEFEALTSLFEGATVQATTDTDGLQAEGADTLTVGDNQLSGSATGEEHTLRTEGAIIEFVSESTSKDLNGDSTSGDDEGVFTLKVDVTAFESDIYVNKTAASGTTMGTAGMNFLVTDGSGTAQGTSSAGLSSSLSSSADTESGRYVVDEGTTEEFTLTVNYDPAVSGFYGVQIYSLNFRTTNDDPNTQQRALPAEDFETDPLSI